MEGEGGVTGRRILRIPDLGFSNAYLIEADSLILIDTGTSSAGQRILSYIEKIGKKPSDVTDIILTHSDADHSGCAAMLKRATGAKLAIHRADAPRLSGENKKIKEARGLGGAVLSLAGAFMKVERVNPDVLLSDGDTVGPLRVIHTPGHTDGSICLYLPEEALFVGDILRTAGSGELKLPAGFMSRDIDEVRSSVARISKLHFSILLPGHGRSIDQGAAEKVREFVARGYR